MTTLRRTQLEPFLSQVTRSEDNPNFPIFSVYCARRTPLYLRYDPVNDWTLGPLTRVGDHCVLGDDKDIVTSENGKKYSLNPTDPKEREKFHLGRSPIFTRKGVKVLIEDVGTYRWMIVRNFNPSSVADRKHYAKDRIGTLKSNRLISQEYQGAERKRRSINPSSHGLFLVYGMYNDLTRNGRKSRYGQWRPWAFICLRTTQKIRVYGQEFVVTD